LAPHVEHAGDVGVRFALLEPLARQAGKRREFYRQFTALQDIWRQDSHEREAFRTHNMAPEVEAAESEAVA
jgi:hypothetical protein